MTEKELTRLYRQFDMECALVSDRVRSARSYEPFLFVPTPEAKEEISALLSQLLRRADSLPAPEPVFSFLKNHFIEYLKGQKSSLESRFRQPSQFIDGITRFLGFIGRKDSRFAEERAYILERRLSQVDELWNAIKALLPGQSAARVSEVAASCEMLSKIAALNKDRVPAHYEGLPDKSLARISSSLGDLSRKALEWAGEARRIGGVVTTEPSAHLGIQEYAATLEEERGVSLEEILKWYEEEVTKTREEMFEIASKISVGGNTIEKSVQGVVEALNKYAGPAANAEEMFSRCKEYLARAREGLKGYVNLPEEVCRVVPMEEEGRAENPWGGYRGGCPRRRPLLGEMVLNPDNVPAITDGWIKINAIHEAYPGHHVQFVRAIADPLPETVKEGARSTPLTEGTAHRSERVFEFVFPEDPFYPLFVAYRRHHTAVRIKADLYLHYFHRPVEDAVKLYIEELAFDRGSARGQVLAQERRPGYFTTYYYGLRKLLDLQAKFGYDDKSYTEMLFAAGRVSLRTFEAFLALSEADRKRFLTQFSSMLSY